MRLSIGEWGDRARLAADGQTSAMAVALAGLYLAGGIIGTLSLVLPHPAAFDDGALWGNLAVAFGAGLALVLFRELVPFWAIQVSVLAGTLVITRAVYLGGNPDGYYVIWYLWVGVYSFFFGRFWGLAQLAAIGAAYAWVLAELPDRTPVASWVVTLTGIAVAGALVDYLAQRLRSETAASKTRASNLEAVGEVARQLATQSDPRAVGWAICTAALRASGATAAVLWRPNTAGSELIAAAAAGVRIERTALPFTTPGSGAIRSFTSSEPRLESLNDPKATQELSPQLEVGRELARAARDATPICVAVLDLDHFKAYNDEHGHQAGDRFLKQVAGVWAEELRATDILARHGGEEFALAMPGTDLENAERMLARLREGMPNGETCSGGVCTWDGSESAESLLDRADRALYDAKAAGRDRVITG